MDSSESQRIQRLETKFSEHEVEFKLTRQMVESMDKRLEKGMDDISAQLHILNENVSHGSLNLQSCRADLKEEIKSNFYDKDQVGYKLLLQKTELKSEFEHSVTVYKKIFWMGAGVAAILPALVGVVVWMSTKGII